MEIKSNLLEEIRIIVSGNVKYTSSNLPIQNAKVSVENSFDNIETFTDKCGNFSIPIGINDVLIFQHDKTNQVVRLNVNQNIKGKLDTVYMMDELNIQQPVYNLNPQPNTTQQEAVCPPCSSNKKVLFGFITGVVIGSLLSSKKEAIKAKI